VGAGLVVLGGDLRARAEERVLLAAFGERYCDYIKRTSRLIPGLY
jgi:protein-S-isoprenylcysteine O-methyltransferase Ste14